jgi:NAD(P)-dependent dehydrogenase (short-subunit alcohol dehydrogenase family)
MNLDVIKEKFSLEGQTALITGSGRGIGRGLAIALAKAGADIVVVDIIEENVWETARSLGSTVGIKAHPYVADLSKIGMIPKYVEESVDKCKKIDILINNAGIQIRKPALEFTIEEWNKVITIHLTVSFAMAQAIVPEMIKRGGGKIINIVSLNSVMAVPHIMAYVAAKSGVAGLTRSMAVEWSQYNIRANAIGPGFCRTELTEKLLSDQEKMKWVMGRIPMKRLAEPENDLGYVAVFLSSNASSYITGQTIFVDGGWLAS